MLAHTHSQARLHTSEYVNCSFVLLFHNHRRHDHEKKLISLSIFYLYQDVSPAFSSSNCPWKTLHDVTSSVGEIQPRAGLLKFFFYKT